MTSTCPNCHVRYGANWHDIVVAGIRTRVWTCPICQRTVQQRLRTRTTKDRINIQDWLLVKHTQGTRVSRDVIGHFRNLRCNVDDTGYVHTVPSWREVDAKIQLCDKVVAICEEAIDLADQFDMTKELGAIFNINCGLHSGIKPCCIMHNMAVTTGVGMMFDLQSESYDCQWETPYGAFILAFQSQQQGAVEHALCPACILAGIAAPPLRSCDCWQGHDIRKYPNPVYKLIN